MLAEFFAETTFSLNGLANNLKLFAKKNRTYVSNKANRLDGTGAWTPNSVLLQQGKQSKQSKKLDRHPSHRHSSQWERRRPKNPAHSISYIGT